jgi:hypothetical protein
MSDPDKAMIIASSFGIEGSHKVLLNSQPVVEEK